MTKKFALETPTKAVNTCFKLYHALNAQYQQEVDIVWTFIQQYVYELKTLQDMYQ